MEKLDIKTLEKYVNSNISIFHDSKINILGNLTLKKVLLKKNPYLFRAKNITIASDLIKGLLEAYISSMEEKLFGDFLEGLAVFVASKTFGGKKSSATGIDLEFDDKNIRYLVSVKSGPNWGNRSQHDKQLIDFKKAVMVQKQAKSNLDIQPILGICYGKTKTAIVSDFYKKIIGQSFWHLLSNNENLYKDLIIPIGYRAKEHNEDFFEKLGQLTNSFTLEFSKEFCVDGLIDWAKIVEFNSSNMPKSKK